VKCTNHEAFYYVIFFIFHYFHSLRFIYSPQQFAQTPLIHVLIYTRRREKLFFTLVPLVICETIQLSQWNDLLWTGWSESNFQNVQELSFSPCPNWFWHLPSLLSNGYKGFFPCR